MTPQQRLERRRFRRADRLHILVSVIVVLCVAGMTASVWVIERQLSADRATLGGQHELILESCVRLNILRAEDNVSHYADFRVFRVVYRQSVAQLRSRRLPRRYVSYEREFLGKLSVAIRQKAWTPLTDCRDAVNQRGASYRAPRPIQFVRHLPPRQDLFPPPNGAALLGG